MKQSFYFIFLILLITLTSCSKDKTEENLPIINWWAPDRSGPYYSNMSDFPTYRTLQEKFRCQIIFNHTNRGEHDEQIRILVGSKKYPDIISHDFINNYSGGIEKAISDGVILPISPDLQDSAPNLMRYLENHPELLAEITLKNGDLFCIPSISADAETRTYIGPIIREDLLIKTGLKSPTTMQEWYTVLKRFKTLNLVDIPLSFYGGKIKDTNAFIGAFGIGWGFFIDNGQVKYGEATSNYYDFLVMFSNWISEGLVDRASSTSSIKSYKKRAKKLEIGIYIDYLSSIEKITNSKKEKNPSISLKPIAYPTLLKGEVPEFGHLMPALVPFASAYITPSANNPHFIMQLLDYAFSKEGSLLFNFGIEGESYNLVNGKPTLSNLIKSNPKGLSYALGAYVSSAPYPKDVNLFKQILSLPAQMDALGIWGNTNMKEHLLPRIPLTVEDAKQISNIMKRVKPFVNQKMFDFLYDGVDLKSFNKYMSKLNEMGIREVESILQQAYNSKMDSQIENF